MISHVGFLGLNPTKLPTTDDWVILTLLTYTCNALVLCSAFSPPYARRFLLADFWPPYRLRPNAFCSLGIVSPVLLCRWCVDTLPVGFVSRCFFNDIVKHKNFEKYSVQATMYISEMMTFLKYISSLLFFFIWFFSFVLRSMTCAVGSFLLRVRPNYIMKLWKYICI